MYISMITSIAVCIQSQQPNAEIAPQAAPRKAPPLDSVPAAGAGDAGSLSGHNPSKMRRFPAPSPLFQLPGAVEPVRAHVPPPAGSERMRGRLAGRSKRLEGIKGGLGLSRRHIR